MLLLQTVNKIKVRLSLKSFSDLLTVSGAYYFWPISQLVLPLWSTPLFPPTIPLCHFLSPLLPICTSCPEDVSYLDVWTVREVYVFILLPWVTRHSVTSGGRVLRFPRWQSIPLPAVTALGIIRLKAPAGRELRSACAERRHVLFSYVCIYTSERTDACFGST